MSTPLLETIRAWLTAEKAVFRELHHEPTRTSEESARVRGEALGTGGKAILLKTDSEFRLFVLPADRKLDSAKVRAQLPVKKIRFATPEELLALTGLVPGSVPPFGPPILPFALHLDQAWLANEKIAFNAGSLSDSIIMPFAEYQRVAQPARIFDFSQPPCA